MSGLLRIGQVAKTTGLSIDSIRFYEKQRLLRPAHRSEGGFRLFAERDVDDLKFIQQAQELGFSLSEIRELLLLQGDVEACSHVRDLTGAKLDTVRDKIRQLQTLEARLTGCLLKCDDALTARRNSHRTPCPVLAEIATPVGNGKRGKRES
jgi:DNA-binding transcriptional MerR regulator